MRRPGHSSHDHALIRVVVRGNLQQTARSFGPPSLGAELKTGLGTEECRPCTGEAADSPGCGRPFLERSPYGAVAGIWLGSPALSWSRAALILAWGTFGLGFTACSGNPAEPAPELLVDHAAWALVATPEADPFAVGRGRPTVHACQDAAYFEPTPGTLEIELAYCRERYVSLHQASRLDLHAGDVLHFNLSHLLLRPLTEDVTEAYLALAVRETIVWERTLQILAVANNYIIDVPLGADFPATSDVVLHLDNHGENSYTLSPFEVVRAQ